LQLSYRKSNDIRRSTKEQFTKREFDLQGINLCCGYASQSYEVSSYDNNYIILVIIDMHVKYA